MLSNAVAVLDGATNPEEPYGRDGGWYADNLAQALAPALAVETDIAGAVATAIATVAGEHALIPGVSPSSTVAVASWDDTQIRAYVLGDSVIAVYTDDAVSVLTDRRLQQVGVRHRQRYRSRLAAGHGYDDLHTELLRQLAQAERAHRNRDDGYWIAEAVPDAAHRGFTALWPRHRVRGLLLATDGVTIGIDDGKPEDWQDAWQLVQAAGPAAFLARIEAVEQADPDGRRWARSKPSDDKTLAVVRFEKLGTATAPLS